MAAAALSRDREDVQLRTEIDGLKVVASIKGSMEYRSVYQWVRAQCVP